MKAESAFEIARWDQAPYDEPSDGPPLDPRDRAQGLPRALEGEGVAELLTCGELAYTANERVRARSTGAPGRSCSSTARWDGGQWGFVVPGSGTGELAGLRGDARLDHGRIVLDCALD